MQSILLLLIKLKTNKRMKFALYHNPCCRSVLKLGSSAPWQDAMELMTGQRTFSSEALYEYFDPLLEWLKEENKDRVVGWTSDNS